MWQDGLVSPTGPQYLDHLDQYGDRLTPGMYVGVGSVCKRNARTYAMEAILTAIMIKRPDLKLHGFGLKLTSLKSDLVRRCLHSSDSMAWSFHARRNGGNRNDWREAKRFADTIENQQVQRWLFDGAEQSTRA